MAGQSTVDIARWSDGFVIRISGRGTLQDSPSFRDFVVQCFQRRESVVVDLATCDYLDSTFLGCLIGLHKRSMARDDTSFQVVADEQARVRLFSTTLLTSLLDFAAAVPIPVSEFVPIEHEQTGDTQLGKHVMQCHRILADLGGPDANRFQAIADQLAGELQQRQEPDAAGGDKS